MSPEKFHETLRESQRAQADLYAWGAVIDLLEGSSAPSSKHNYAITERVIATAKAATQKALKRMDAADAKLKAAAQAAKGA